MAIYFGSDDKISYVNSPFLSSHPKLNVDDSQWNILENEKIVKQLFKPNSAKLYLKFFHNQKQVLSQFLNPILTQSFTDFPSSLPPFESNQPQSQLQQN